MNYKKLVLVGFISAFVAVLTSVLGVTGTIIGSVISSVLYNMLSEVLENPVTKGTFSHDFEWEIAYIFPLVVIALIQLLLIFALLSEYGLLPHGFVNFYMLIQNIANNNLYRILGLALLVISAYPIFLRPDFVKKEHGLILVFVAVIFLARGFVDAQNRITNLYDFVFIYFDLPIALIAFILLAFVIIKILYSKNSSKSYSKSIEFRNSDENNNHFNSEIRQTPVVNKSIRVKNHKRVDNYNNKSNNPDNNQNLKFRKKVNNNVSSINKSSDKIHFESNDLLDDYKK